VGADDARVNVLRVDRLCMMYGGVRALDGVSFQVGEGERLAIIGPNGAGKTTLFNALIGAPPPSSGSVFLLSQDITHLPTHQRTHLGLARSFQLVTLFSRLTVMQHVQLAVFGTRPARYRVAAPVEACEDVREAVEMALAAAGLWERRQQLVGNLAYGEQRKLELVMTLASRPRVLLLDEPGSGLTAAERGEVGDLIRGLGQVTVLIVDHDMDLVFGVAERILVMQHGRIIAEGTPDAIRADSKVRDIYLGKWARADARAR
jgi:branched-chain amino acid transport system ATP-binding protein